MRVLIASGDFIVSELTLRQPREGLWRGRIKVATPNVVEGESVILSDDSGNEWVGVARAVVVTGPTAMIDMVGGGGQLDGQTTERYYAGGISIASLLSDLCADVGESPDTDVSGSLAQWRTRGESLRNELARLARFTTDAFRIVPGGLVSLSVASGEADPPGRFTGEAYGCRTYETSTIAPVAGQTVDGWEVGVALWQRSPSTPLRASLWRADPVGVVNRPSVVGGRILGASDSSVDVITDTGVELQGLSLWSAAGLASTPSVGARVLVLDLGGDPRTTIALAGAVDARADSLEIAALLGVTIEAGVSPLSAKIAITPASVNVTGIPPQLVPFPLVRTGDQVLLTFPAPIVPGTPILVTVGASLNITNGLPSTLKSS